MGATGKSRAAPSPEDAAGGLLRQAVEQPPRGDVGPVGADRAGAGGGSCGAGAAVVDDRGDAGEQRLLVDVAGGEAVIPVGVQAGSGPAAGEDDATSMAADRPARRESLRPPVSSALQSPAGLLSRTPVR